MAKQVKRVVPRPMEATFVGDDMGVPSSLDYDVIAGYEPEEPVYHWTEWAVVEQIPDSHPTYRHTYRNDGAAFRTPTMAESKPYIAWTIVEERALLCNWVDAVEGPKTMKVKTEQRRRRT